MLIVKAHPTVTNSVWLKRIIPTLWATISRKTGTIVRTSVDMDNPPTKNMTAKLTIMHHTDMLLHFIISFKISMTGVAIYAQCCATRQYRKYH
jgi:hypothetical protein